MKHMLLIYTDENRSAAVPGRDQSRSEQPMMTELDGN
jgi:hypothetical protein